MAAWDAEQYLKFASERARPFHDLLARVCVEPRDVADLGCGPGALTRTLAERWPAARVVGVDNSADMLANAQPIAGRLDFVQADLNVWEPPGPLDLVVSNAALQWLPDHERFMGRLAAMVAPGGTLAVQVPNRFREPDQVAIDETSADPRWAALVQGVGLSEDSVAPIAWYVRRLHDLGFAVDAWQTTYVHVLTGADPVLEWMKGTALRPILERLGQWKEAYLHDLGERFRSAYPEQNGVTLFPFPRLFFVATRGG